MTAAGRTDPAEAEVLGYFESLSNWGRWGTDDELGTINHITPDVRVRAAGLVRLGESVSCGWDIDPRDRADPHSPPPLRMYLQTGQGLCDGNRVYSDYMRPGERQASAHEWVGLQFHGYSQTHLDGLAHIFWDARMYNDRPAELVTAADGATANSVHRLRHGITTRGVLVDAARHRGVDWLGPGESVGAEELREILREQHVELGPGDAVLLRTGAARARRERGADDVEAAGQPGWQASCLPVFHDHDTAVVGADVSQDAIPSGYDEVRFPLHAVGISALGLCLIDNCDLEELARRCAELGRWEFLLTVSPLRLVGGSGSPVNPIATF
ncbi:MAG: cyclase family protein [Nocardioidaceae bacterium]|nr:cyclase family protein [Nocardioidaceae bacterium]